MGNEARAWGGKSLHQRFLAPAVQPDSSQKEFSPAHQAGRPAQKNIAAFSANCLRSAGRVYFYGRLCVAGGDRGHGGGAGTGARRKGFSHAALQEADLHVILSVDQDQFYVYSL